jgi:uncharacterized protein (TIGR03067 family)
MKYLFTLALLAFPLAAASRADDKKTDKDLLQGTWVFVSLERNGKKVTDDDDFQYVLLKDAKWTFKGDTLKSPLWHEKVVVTFTLDPAKKPPAIDVVVKTADSKDTVPMLYELKDDTLKLCTGGAPGERPKEFNSKGGQAILTLKRDEKKPEK